MSYRDDQDALLARADALEGDLERAKAEAERLRGENERLREAAPDDGALEALAGHADEAAAEAAAQREREARKRRPRARPAGSGPRDRLAVELADRYTTPVPALLVPAVVGALAIVGLADAMWAIPGGVACGIVGGGLGLWAVRRARIAWIRRLPFPLDRDSLADRINDGPLERRIRVRVTFADRVAEGRRATIAKAVTGAWGDAAGTWDGDDLIVTTAAIESRAEYTNRRGITRSYFVPAPFLHACRRLFVDCLVPVHAAAPIASAAFEE